MKAGAIMAPDESESELESKETLDTLAENCLQRRKAKEESSILFSLHLCNDEMVKFQSYLITSQVRLIYFLT